METDHLTFFLLRPPFHLTLAALEGPHLKSFLLAFGALVFQREGKHLLKMFVPGGWLLPAASGAGIMNLESSVLAQISMASN